MLDFGVNIISTRMDLKLFTDSTYQNKVYNALQRARKEREITDKHSMACYEDCIVVKDQNKNIIAIKKF